MRISDFLALGALTIFIVAIAGSDAAYSAPAAQSVTIDDTASGWTWSGMESINDSSFTGGTAHAGPIGSSGVYTFHGTGVKINTISAPDIVASGRRHKMGKLKITIDGVEKTVANLAASEPQFDMCVWSISGLDDKNHVLQVEPRDGWGVIDGITVLTQGNDNASADTSNADLKKDTVALFDPLDNASLVWNKSPRWEIAGDYPETFQGDHSRIRRTADDQEYLAYRSKNISGFIVRVYTRAELASFMSIVKIHTSSDGGLTTKPMTFSIAGSFPGGGSGGYTGCDLIPAGTLPAGTDTLYITFAPGAGAWWDPQLSQVTILTRN